MKINLKNKKNLKEKTVSSVLKLTSEAMRKECGLAMKKISFQQGIKLWPQEICFFSSILGDYLSYKIFIVGKWLNQII